MVNTPPPPRFSLLLFAFNYYISHLRSLRHDGDPSLINSIEKLFREMQSRTWPFISFQ